MVRGNDYSYWRLGCWVGVKTVRKKEDLGEYRSLVGCILAWPLASSRSEIEDCDYNI